MFKTIKFVSLVRNGCIGLMFISASSVVHACGYTTDNCTLAEEESVHKAYSLIRDIVFDGNKFSSFQSCIDSAPMIEFSGSRSDVSLNIGKAFQKCRITKIQCYVAPQIGAGLTRAGEAPVRISGNKLKIDKDYVRSESTDKVAGVIAHEIMHNRGYRHSQNSFGTQYYSNTVPEQVESCVRDKRPNPIAGDMATSVQFIQLGRVEVLSTDHKREGDGVYFNFDRSSIDAIFGSRNWDGVTITIKNERTGLSNLGRLWRSSNGGSRGNAHGRWIKGIGLEMDQWRTGDSFIILALGAMRILSTDHAKGPQGMYFNFDIDDADRLLGDKKWDNTTRTAFSTTTKAFGNVRLLRQRNGGSRGNAHGRWDKYAGKNDWKRGDRVIVLW